MDVYKLKFTVLQLEIFKLFCIKAGQQISQRQISKHLGVSPTAVAKSLPLLEKEGIITITKGVTNVNFIALNQSSKKVRAWKQSENIKHVHDSGLAEYLEQEFPESTISIAGSYSIGTDTINSEIEIIITGAQKKSLNVTPYEKKIDRKIMLKFEQRSQRPTGIIIGGVI